MPVDPQLAPLLERMEAAPPFSSNTPERARELFSRLNALAAGATEEVEVGAVEDIEVPGGAGPLRARVYRPTGDGPHPTLAFFHGGGFTVGDVESYDAQTRLLCREVGAVVLSTDYRLAPEHPYPAAVEDALAVTRWAAESIDELGGDGERLAIGGDSAGGNLSAVVALELRDGGPPLRAQLLIYPPTDMKSEQPSLEENARGYFLTLDDVVWFHGNYLPNGDGAADPRCSPLRADDLSGLPPAVVATAQYDPLRDDGDAYAEALAAAGVRVIHRRYDGLVHGFFGLAPFSAAAERAVREVCADLRGLLA